MESLKRTQMSPDLSTVLTQTGSKIEISLAANGTAEISMRSPKSIVPLADERDIKAISGLNAAVNEERKLAQKESLTKGVITMGAAVKSHIQESDKVSVSMPKGYAEVLKTMNSSIDSLAESVFSLSSMSFAEVSIEAEIKQNLIEFASRAQNAIAAYLVHRANVKEHEETKKVSHFLREAKCPEYIFKRLTDKSLNKPGPEFNLRHIIFPSDPTKGLYLTVREIFEQNMNRFCFDFCDADMINNALLDMNILGPLLRLEGDDVTGFTKWDEPKSLGSKIAGIPFFYPAPAKYADVTGYYSFLAKNGKRGLAFRSGTALSPQDFLRFFGTIAKKVSYMTMPLINRWSEFAGMMFPGFDFDPSKEGKDFFNQLKEWSIQPGNELSRNRIFESQETDKMRMFLTIFGTSANGFGAIELIGQATLVLLGFDKGSDHAIPIADLFNARVNSEKTEEYQAPKFDENKVPVVDDKGKPVLESRSRFMPKHLIYPALNLRKPARSLPVGNLMGVLAEKSVNFSVNQAKAILGPDIQNFTKVKDEKEDKRIGLVERSVLGTNAKEVVAILSHQNKTTLAKRMDRWFRLFMSPVVQNAVAGIVAARLEVYFESPVTFSATDRSIFFDGALALDDQTSSDEEEPGDDAGDPNDPAVEEE